MEELDDNQNSFSLNIPKNPIINLSKRAGIIRQTKELSSIVKDITYYYFLETFIEKICCVAIYGKRKTLIPEDVEAICSLEDRDLLVGINKFSIDKTKGLLLHKNRSKIERLRENNDTYSTKQSDELNHSTFIDNLLEFEVPESENFNNEEIKKKRKKRPGTLAIQQIRKLQKESDCLEIPISNFASVVRDIASKKIPEVHLREGTSRLIQLATENWIYNLFVTSDYLACHRNVQTVSHKDVYLALLMKGIINHSEWLDLLNVDGSDSDNNSNGFF